MTDDPRPVDIRALMAVHDARGEETDLKAAILTSRAIVGISPAPAAASQADVRVT